MEPSLAMPADLTGVLPSQWLERAVDAGVVWSEDYKIPPESIQPASIDLRLGETAYRLRCSFLPEGTSVDEKLEDLAMEDIDLHRGAVLERNRPYLIPLIEEVRLPTDLRAKANPRSSTGRLDVFTRVITDRSHRFDEIAAGYHGRLWLEVVSRSFTIKVAERLSLNQLRLIRADARVPDVDVPRLHAASPMLYRGGAPVEELSLAGGLFLSLDLGVDPVGYRAKKNSRLLDLSLRDHYEVEDFWEPVHAERGRRMVLEPEEFYLLLSDEAVTIAPELAAEMSAYEPTSGELRTHYAGFFDPGFGFGTELRGTKAVLEVRAHDVPFMVEHGQRVCKLGFERMAEAPQILYGGGIGSSYQQQTLTVSKHFKRA